ncbi:16S rRNA (guanine(966)-N(2))-methyltransferase RsmD [Zoogloea sp.]|uniref:16S rRNA (guanine(966)-N(2))-methyltransferase RsmD n=1 Tax=Zoogloea sp. TaxID=49181 RepID=UPI0035B12D9E
MSRVRIIGGEWRSRQVDVSAVKGLRPTPARVRETLFNWLGQELDGWDCLDLFAGSGALGFEAASRGAASVSMIEQDALAYSVLQNSAKTLKAECVQLVRGDALKFARSAGRTYDLIFLDPPYRMGWIEKITPLLPALLKEGGQVYVEAEYDIEHIDQLTRIKHGKAGQVFYHLFATCA